MTPLRRCWPAALLVSCALSAVSVSAAAGDAGDGKAPSQSCAGLHVGAPCKNGGDAGDQGGVCLSEMCSVPNFLCDGAVSDSGNGACGTVSTPCMLCEVQSHTPIPEGGLQPIVDAPPDAPGPTNLFGDDASDDDGGTGATDADSGPRDAAADAHHASGGSGGCGVGGGGELPSGVVSFAGLALAVVVSRRRR